MNMKRIEIDEADDYTPVPMPAPRDSAPVHPSREAILGDAVDAAAMIWALTHTSPAAIRHCVCIEAGSYTGADFMMLVRDFLEELSRAVDFGALEDQAREYAGKGDGGEGFIGGAEDDHLQVAARLIAWDVVCADDRGDTSQAMIRRIVELVALAEEVSELARFRLLRASQKMVDWGYLEKIIAEPARDGRVVH
jgi:hypothetical protein